MSHVWIRPIRKAVQYVIVRFTCFTVLHVDIVTFFGFLLLVTAIIFDLTFTAASPVLFIAALTIFRVTVIIKNQV